MLHNILIAVDGSRNSLRAVEYAGRVFASNAEARLVLFHVLPAISRMSLNEEEIKAIDGRKAGRADLADLYWQVEDEEKMGRFFCRGGKSAGAGWGATRTDRIQVWGERRRNCSRNPGRSGSWSL